MPEVLENQLRQSRVIRPSQPRQQMPPPIPIELLIDQPFERRILEAIRIRMLKRSRHQRRARDLLRIKLRRQVRFDTEFFLLMSEVHPQLVAKELQRLLRILVVSQQRLPREDFIDPLRVPDLLNPLRDERLNLVELLGLLRVQAVEVVKILGPRHERLQRHRPIRRESEVLDKADLSSSDPFGQRLPNEDSRSESQRDANRSQPMRPSHSNLACSRHLPRKEDDPRGSRLRKSSRRFYKC